jgi:hypothetical protein
MGHDLNLPQMEFQNGTTPPNPPKFLHKTKGSSI